MALPVINYDTDLPYYIRPLERPTFPPSHNFTRETWRNYYDLVKVEIQLFHNETKDGCITMMEGLVYPEHMPIFSRLLKRYQVEPMESNEFWTGYLGCVSLIKKMYDSVPDSTLLFDGMGKLALEIDNRRYFHSPRQFFETWMMALQEGLRGSPNIKLFKGLVNLLHQRLPISRHLQREMGDVIVLKDDNRFGVFAKLNILDVMRRLTVLMVRHADTFTGEIIKSLEVERQQSIQQKSLRRYDLAQMELRRQLEGVTCIFCGSGDGHEFNECELLQFLIRTNALTMDEEYRVCDHYKTPLQFESVPWCLSKELRAYLAMVGPTSHHTK